jgi:hypothetical protein
VRDAAVAAFVRIKAGWPNAHSDECGYILAMLVRGQAGVKVGDQIKVQLASLNIERGFIDFVRIGK